MSALSSTMAMRSLCAGRPAGVDSASRASALFINGKLTRKVLP